LALAWLCLRGRKASLQLAGVLWFASNLSVYQIGVLWQHDGGLRAYLQDIAVAFAVSPDLVNTLLQGLTLYLLFGSAFCWFRLWLNQSPRGQAAAAKFQRMACPVCGGHIEFPAQNAGRPISCPHCQKTITLRDRQNLKMSCFFCQGHVEFPAHAVGTKMACPHCKMDITLKEPA
jgi:hypothetical protein